MSWDSSIAITMCANMTPAGKPKAGIQVWPGESKREMEGVSLKKKKWSGGDREQEAAMRQEYGTRRRAVDGEMGLHDKLFFMVWEEKDFICPSTTSSSQFTIGTC